MTINETRPMCDVCGLSPATVFDPSFAMWCAGCDALGLGHLAVLEHTSEYAEAIGRMFDNATLVGESLGLADRAHIYEDTLGAHWGWVRKHETWVAWNTAPYRVGVGAVGPFRRVMRNVVEAMLSNVAKTPAIAATSVDTLAGEPVEQTADNADGYDPVNRPKHYNQGPPCKGCGRPIECLDITEGMGYCLGNTIKYVWRCDLKNDAIEDLRKARTYLDREIARREAQLVADFKEKNGSTK